MKPLYNFNGVNNPRSIRWGRHGLIVSTVNWGKKYNLNPYKFGTLIMRIRNNTWDMIF